jgi:DNA-binding CsgD family transcriptional regulator
MKDKHGLYEAVAVVGVNLLTPKQKETVILVCDGLSNPEIAEHMGISVKTVENQRQMAMDKLRSQGVHNVATLVKWAIVTGVYQL